MCEGMVGNASSKVVYLMFWSGLDKLAFGLYNAPSTSQILSPIISA